MIILTVSFPVMQWLVSTDCQPRHHPLHPSHSNNNSNNSIKNKEI